MTLTVTPARPNFVAEVSGVDMREPPSRTLIFRDQLITDEQRVAFTRPFGRPETAVKAYRPGFKARLALEVADISNLDEAILAIRHVTKPVIDHNAGEVLLSAFIEVSDVNALFVSLKAAGARI